MKIVHIFGDGEPVYGGRELKPGQHLAIIEPAGDEPGEVDRLTDALRTIAEGDYDNAHDERKARDIARSALGAKP